MDSTITPMEALIGYNETFSQGFGFSGSKEIAQRVPSNRMRAINIFNSSLNGGANASHSNNKGKFSYIDMNADGLPDMVNVSKDSIWYNLGYCFAEGEKIQGLVINEGLSNCASVSIGFSMSQYSISGGFCSSISANETNKRMIDVNGDGLPDRLHSIGGNMQVSPLVDREFTTSYPINISNPLNSSTTNSGFNLGVTAGISLGIIPVKLCFGLQYSPWYGSETQTHGEFMDLNGDGYVDYIHEHINTYGNNRSATVYYNQNGLTPVNLLKTITNPTGQIIELTYEQTTPSVEQRGRSWRLAGVIDSIIAADQTACHRYVFSYANPYHDNYERTDFGYASVTTIDNNEKILSETFSNANFISRGEKMSDLLTDSLNRPYIGHSHQIGYKDINEQPVISPHCDDASIWVDYEYYRTDYYERDSTPTISTQYELQYDRFYNIVKRTDRGDISFTDDDIVQTISYLQSSQNRWRYNLISLPTEERVMDYSGNLLRKTGVRYNYFGRPRWFDRIDSVHSLIADTYFGYDEYGNIGEIIYPYDYQSGGTRDWLKITYDTLTHSYPASLLNPFMEQQFTFYDYRFGLPTMVIDPSGNAIQYEYDNTGRLINVRAPRGYLTNDEPYTIHYSYRIRGHELDTTQMPHSLHSYIIKLALAEGTIHAECNIYDQRGYEIQKKHLSSLNSAIKWVTNGLTKFDAFYNPIKKSLPFISTIDVGTWDNNPTSSDEMQMDYDVLNRITHAQHFDNTNRYWSYGFDLDCDNRERLRIKFEDENHMISTVLKSPQDWTMRATTPDGYTTCYEYNPLGERTKVIDADGYETTYAYDALGNCTQRVHPDAGVTRWTYGPSGLLESMSTNIHINHSQSISYSYTHGRLFSIKYPAYPQNNVFYEYDYAGRIYRRWDGVGRETLLYDELGNVVTSIKHIVIPTETAAYEFTTLHHYDSFGRIRQIIYPDKDTVRYQYYTTGELATVTHKQQGYYEEPLISKLYYNVFGQQTYRLYGNGVESFYTYSSQRQWLTNKQTRILSGSQIQDLDYSYDNVGNITQIKQQAGTWSSLGGSYTNDYIYDHQYRLISATETSSPNFFIDFSASYSPAGRLGHDFCSSNNVNKQLTYGYDESGMTHQPRVIYDGNPELSYDLYWDANGNLAQVIQCGYNKFRFHEWDDNNRLRAVIGPNQVGFYGYDGNGDRVWKLTGGCSTSSQNGEVVSYGATIDNAVLYPNPYLTITPTGYTKHYYIGSERIATAIGEGGWGNALVNKDQHDAEISTAFFKRYENDLPCEQYQQTINYDIAGEYREEIQYNCAPKCLNYLNLNNKYDYLAKCINTYSKTLNQEKTFFTHSDHLGSASWITDSGGYPVQYIHYAPYGELMANQKTSSFDERYKFTGKERDAESGYYYHGARFLLSDAGIWLSVDPLADKYPNISPYAYCAWNPIKFVDPDGRRIGINGEYKNEDGTTSIATFYYDEVDGDRGFYCNGQRLNTEYANSATDAIGKIHDGGRYGKMLIDAVVKDDRTIKLTPVIKPEQNASLCDLGALKWCMKDYEPGSELVPSFITLSHEFFHFITKWYNIADYGTWYDKVTNDEKLVVNFENLIRNENRLDPRRYYGIPSAPGELGDGEIPQWDWVGNYLEIISNF